MKLNATSILEITGGEQAVAAADPSFDLIGLTWDSRTVYPGCIYAALPGERVDGNDYIVSAIRGGAMLALTNRRPDGDVCDAAQAAGAGVVVVEDVAESIMALAAAWRRMLSATVIGITGSVGKTTTKALTRQVLSSRFKTCATKGNFNNELGAPYTVLSADADCEMLIVEMGMDDLGQIARIACMARPDMGLVNNVGISHLERLGSRENIARAKAELFEALGEGGMAFVNASDDMAAFLQEHARLAERGVNVSFFDGVSCERPEGERAVWARDVSVDDEGHPHFVLFARGFESCEGEASVPCSLALRGAHNVSNACAAASIGLACGLSLAETAAALSSAEPEAGRQEMKRASSGAVIFDDSYNASPASMQASLAMLASYKTQGRKVAILGDMGELGEMSEEGHRSTGRAAACARVDALICVGDLSRDIVAGALEAGFDAGRIHHVASAEDAVSLVSGSLSEGDVVLVKASHYMRLDRVVEGILE